MRSRNCLILLSMIIVSSALSLRGETGLYVRGQSYYEPFDSLLAATGLSITISEEIPNQSTLADYDLVLVNSYSACNTTTAGYLEQYVFDGGGLILISGTPLFLGMSAISSWFGATNYVNSGEKAYYVLNPAPFGVDIVNGDLLTDHTGSYGMDAAVSGIFDTTHILAQWQDGKILCFWNTYGTGRILYHGSMYTGLEELNEMNNAILWSAGIRWAAGLIPPTICGDINGSGVLNIVDVTRLIAFLYKGWSILSPLQAADVDHSGIVNILDVTYLIGFLYKGGPEPNCT